MDQKTTIIAVAVVAVVAIAAVAAFVIMNNNSGGGGDDPGEKGVIPDLDEFPARLAVLGNANCDDYLDNQDVKYVENLISKGNINYTKEWMCDANKDGYINKTDVEVIKKMINNQQDIVYYVGVHDYDIRSYDMSHPETKVVALIQPPIDTMLVLDKSLIVGVDDRLATTGSAYDRYKDVLDLGGKVTIVGSCGSPDKQILANLMKDNGNRLTIVCGQKDYYATTAEEDFEGLNLQVIRMATWENAQPIHGLLTTAYLLQKTDEAYTYLTWYEGVENYVEQKAKLIPASEKKNAITFYPHKGNGQFCLLGGTSAENLKLSLVSSSDIGSAILRDRGVSDVTGDRVNLTPEQLAESCAKYNVDTIIAQCDMPYSSAYTIEGVQGWLDKWEEQLGTLLDGKLYFASGFVYASGVSDIICAVMMGYYMYPDYFPVEDLENYINEFCELIGISDVWNFDNMNLLYGDDPTKDIMNMG